MRTPRLRAALCVLLSALVAVHALAPPSHLLNRRAVPVQDRTRGAALDTATAAPFLGANSAALVPGTPWVMGNMTVTTAVTMALRDLQHDWYKVLGLPPVTLPDLPSEWHTGTVLVFGQDPTMHEEAFRVSVGAPDVAGNYTPVHAVGGGELGCVYAVYHVSQALLGVDPWTHYLDIVPQYSGSVSVAADYAYASGAPAFAVRGWFPNDEDLSGGFFKDPLGESVYTVASFDKMVETLLRLRGNTIIVGTTGFPDERTFDIAVRRGVMIAEHHMTPLGLNVWGWPTGLPYTYRLDPELLQTAWRALAKYQAGRNMLWSVGMRGLWDQPFWAADPAIQSDQERGAIISACISNQTSIIAEETGKPGRYFTYMWAEMLSLLEKGFLHIPDDVTIVWADDGSGIIKGKPLVKEGQGLYYHVMMKDDIANQMTEIVPIHRIIEEIGYMYKKGAANYTIINVSDIKPVPLSLEAVMAFLWDPSPFLAAPAPRAAQHTFTVQWCRRMFGADVAADIANVYELYFNISYFSSDDPNVLRYGDVYLATWGQDLAQMWQMQLNGTAPINATFVDRAFKFVDGPRQYTADLLYNQTLPLEARVPAEHLNVFHSHTVLQVAVHAHGLEMLYQMATAMTAWMRGDRDTAVTGLQASLAQLDQLLSRMRAAEGTGVWKGYYQYDRFDDFAYSHQLVRNVLLQVNGAPVAMLPSQAFYAHLFTYECQRFSETGCNNFPFFFVQPGSMASAVRATCADDPNPPAVDVTSASNSCRNTWTGGLYSGSAGAEVKLEVAVGAPHVPVAMEPLGDVQPVVVRFTVNGSDPVATSPAYTAPFTVYGNTTVRAASFMGTEQVSPVTRAEFNATKQR